MAVMNLSGLDLLATAVIVLDADLRIIHANASAESLFAVGARSVQGHVFPDLFVDAAAFGDNLRQAAAEGRGFVDPNLVLTRPGHEPLHLNCIVTPLEDPGFGMVLELRQIDQQLRIEREETRQSQHEANRVLIRNLAHEIKNPLGGLRGSAQLLERELDRAELREYTQVIIKEADRLQLLMDRLLTPHRPTHRGPMNIHEVCERVRSLLLAEFPDGIAIVRDYDASLPEFQGDREQLIQVVLNIARNAAQAMGAAGAGGGKAAPRGDRPRAEIALRTRIARQVTLAKKHHRLALELQVVDNGPGIPEELRERMFFPLVSGREGGTGLGLTLAQTFVQNHQGVIECESVPGRTCFRVVIPLL